MRQSWSRSTGHGNAGAQATSQTTPQINDIVIRGYLLSVDTGSAEKRVAIGFSSGVSELQTAVEGFQMTNQGLRKLGSGTVDSGGNKTPGMAAPAALAIASGNPLGLIISGGMKVYGEESGSSTIEGRVNKLSKKSPTSSKRDSRSRAGFRAVCCKIFILTYLFHVF